jgi:hypothetical protein
MTLPAHHRARQLPVVLHSDWVGARRAMLRAFSSIFLVGLICGHRPAWRALICCWACR